MESTWRPPDRYSKQTIDEELYEVRGNKAISSLDTRGVVLHQSDSSKNLNLAVYFDEQHRWVALTPEQCLDLAAALAHHALRIKPELMEET